MVVDYFNPRHLNLSQIWEERRQAWLDNVAYNQYFWYAYCVTGLLILSWFVLWWVWDDKVRGLGELAENAADALRYSEHCKREAKGAIRRYNEHLDKCNRLIEDQRSGLVTTPETANLGNFKEELTKIRADNESLRLENTQLQAKLDGKTAELQGLEKRVTEAERKMEARQSQSPNAQLVDRIRRLEIRNGELEQKIAQGGNGKPMVPAEPKRRSEQC
jgi:regulator of replication initiation timing